MGELHKIKWSGETLIGNSQLLHMLVIKGNTNYDVTTWCKMQIGAWMKYSNSAHFSDQNLYETLFYFELLF
jgi:hypothetical protein